MGRINRRPSGKASYKMAYHLISYFKKTSAKVDPDKIACESFNKGAINKKELCIFNPPTQVEIDNSKVEGIHLGDYIFKKNILSL